ncbi:hypothetical protein [Amycolatopsis eburnea]|uniref:Uncharacterized protein n=1 Tax=Amycolatopsis eburnea TaxID=2267691 RepID=A0A3R9DMZ3_9PSEU|nr:hypothetical protein [Amycolatopsis eburnea]RSD22018.1 hypothetical protein EIY87_09385 [Amycolatopsis eburnea]
MLDLKQLKGQKGAIVGAALAVVAVALVLALPSAGAAPAAQQVHVSIIGNLGGSVMIDGGVPTRLDAYDGTDGRDFTASKSVFVTVTSSGDAPWCHVVDKAGKQLADAKGAKPSIVPQTFATGYGPAQNVDAPTIESVTCEVTLG